MFNHMTIVTKRDITNRMWKFPAGTVAEIKCIGNLGTLGISLEGNALGVQSDGVMEVLPFMMVVKSMKSDDFEVVTD